MRKKNKRGCFLDLVLFTTVFFFCMSILIPQLISIKTSPIDSVMKNVLINGVKECIVRDADGKTANFIDVDSFSGKYSRFKVKAISTNSCFKLRAIPEDNIQNWFQIDYDPETRKVSKTCGDPSKKGCDEGNTW